MMQQTCLRSRSRLFVRQVLSVATVGYLLSLASSTLQADPVKVLINITGSGSSAKYIKEGDTTQKPVEITVGTEVTWKNITTDDNTHTATSVKKDTTGNCIFDTGDVDTGAGNEKKILFDSALYTKAGGTAGGQVELEYFCAYHPASMKSKIVLKDASVSSTDVALVVKITEEPMKRFDPKEINVVVGQKVTWKNEAGNETHTATAKKADGTVIFDTADIAESKEKVIEFTQEMYQKAGGMNGAVVSIAYKCKYHPSMLGTIKLGPKPTLTDAAPIVNITEDPVKKFDPKELNIVVGQKVIWKNAPQNETHTATAKKSDGTVIFDTLDIDETQQKVIESTEEIYTKAGGMNGMVVQIPYKCKYHPSMTGIIKLGPRPTAKKRQVKFFFIRSSHDVT